MVAPPVIACCRPLAASPLSDDEAEATAQLFKALADPARVRIVNLLATSGRAGLRLRAASSPSGLSQPTVSHHLKKLTDAGLLSTGAARRLGLLLDRRRGGRAAWVPWST